MTTEMESYQVLRFGAPLAGVQHDIPNPAGTEVLLRVKASGLCHTDIHIWQGGYDLGGGARLSMAQRGVTLPLTLGHEIAGEVVALGPSATGVEVGKQYLVYPWIGCGECKVCRRGKEHICPAPRTLGIFRPGGFSKHVIVPHARYLIDIDHLSPQQVAPYACSGLTVYSALRKLNLNLLKEEPLVIFGAGGLGLMAISLLRALGGAGAIVIEPEAARREAALAMGAIEAINPTAPDLRERVMALNHGGVWAVLDCVGAEQSIQTALDLVAKGGHIIQVGLFGGSISLPLVTLPLRSINIEGSFVGSLEEMRELLALVCERTPKMIPTSCRPLSEAAQAIRDLELGHVVGRVILQP